MKKFKLSVVALAAIGTFASAGGDIAPVEPVVEVPAPVDVSGFYIGVAYSAVNYSSEYVGTVNINDSWEGTYEEDYDAVMLQLGYTINKYVAVEGRYWKSNGDAKWSETVNNGEHIGQGPGSWKAEGTDSNAEFEAWGLYVKPMYPVTEDFDVYALLGYGNNTLSYDGIDDLDENGFQWGLGASYDLTENFSIFADYVHMHSDELSSTTNNSGAGRNGAAWSGEISSDDTIYTINIGLTYRF